MTLKENEWITEKLQGYRLQGETYQLITDGLCQPLKLRITIEEQLLRFYRTDTGEKLLIPTELAEQLEKERDRADSQQQRAERLAEYLRSQGIDPDNLP